MVRHASRLVIAACGVVVGLFVGGVPAGVEAGGGACHVAPAARDAAGTEVQLSGNCFTPTVLRVEPGTRVTFRNVDPAVHHIAGAAYGWGTPWERPFQEGDTAEFTFSEAGTYPYSCYLHIGMAGAIVVGDGRAASSNGTGASAPVVARANDASAEAPPADASVPGSAGGAAGRWVFGMLGAASVLTVGAVVTRRWATRR